MDDAQPTMVPRHGHLSPRLVLPQLRGLPLAPELISPKTWRVLATVRKFDHDGARDAGERPLAVVTRLDNMILDEGAAELLDLLAGLGTPVAYSAAFARIGVGTSTTAEVATQTGLLGTSYYQVMDAGYPARTGRTVEWRATIPETQGNFAWEEWTLDNGSVRARNLNRRKASFGVKSGQEWELTVAVTVSA